MQNITLRSHVGADGNLHLNIPTALTNTELEVFVWLRPIEFSRDSKQETFSEWWAKELASVPHRDNYSERYNEVKHDCRRITKARH
ncbi:MAG: hypothetical protein DRR16_04910 [Candidatus Parabeggiatoa sp. nov. 3]|mgnify:CR=1 FL=1|nr:MAG: hypothetical protein DRR00_21535 [Gammaproteobacteria bacterium]RKZ56658.1 MAG: hypothetical protein DRQ99_28150 [Gammaproteobacteria bacterium]RKZ88442.1 MAG: hypothetical protein DRR16_04910 [Gammaproteobacteria bacterium]HEW97591.1 hypothetical protein [Beggiatoa sp.]